MLSSLVPGAIFPTSGLNRRSTPTPREEKEQRYKRDAYNATEITYDSPVSRSYDVANSSTSLIILNNKYGKNSTRLRGYYSGPSSERFIDPNRHRAKSPRNPDHHYRCLDSSSPKYEPSINTGLEWSNVSNRPPSSLLGEYLHESKSSVNPRRHQSCVGRPGGSPTPGSDRPQSRMSLPPPKYFSQYSDMSVGETLYMWSIEKIYNVGNLKQLKQEQYRKLLQLEAKKGYHGYPEYAKYMRYINNAPNRTYGTGTGTPRAKSAFSNKSTSGRTSPVKTPETRTDKDEESSSDLTESSDAPKRPQTSIGTTRKEDKKQEETKPSRPMEDKQGQGSRSPSRSSRTSLQKLGSMRSLRSKSSSKPSSRASSAMSYQSRDHGGRAENSDHKSRAERPKSRLGRTSDEGASKSKTAGDSKTDNVNRSRSQNGQNNNNISSSSSSLDQKHTMGSNSSLSSKGSESSDYKKPAEKTKTNQKQTPEVKVHRIPSAVDLKDDPDLEEDTLAGVDAKPDAEVDKNNQPEENKDDKQPKDVEKSVKFSDINQDTSNKTDEEKHERFDAPDNVNKSDDAKESEGTVNDDNKRETNKSRLSRQDSFDEDDDRRANRDLDTIEY